MKVRKDIMKVGISLPSQFPFGSTTQMLAVYEQVGFGSYCTGVVGGMSEIMARGMELPVLKNVLSEL